MDANSEQPAAIAATESASANEQEHNDEAMEETEEYSYEGDDYRHFMPRGRGGFRCVSRCVAILAPRAAIFSRCCPRLFFYSPSALHTLLPFCFHLTLSDSRIDVPIPSRVFTLVLTNDIGGMSDFFNFWTDTGSREGPSRLRAGFNQLML